MLNIGKIKLFMIFNLIAVIFFVSFFSSIVVGQTGPFEEVKEKLAGISENERKVLQDLFVLLQEIEEIEREKGEIAQEIEIISQETKALEVLIADEEINYEKKQDVLKQTLKSYQRMGPGSYIEILLDSENLTSFLRRVNTLRDITRNTGELLKSMEESSKKLSDKKMNLDEKHELMKKKQEAMKVSLHKKEQVIEEQQQYLASLGEQKELYQEHLARIEEAWLELQHLFPEAVKEFSRIVEEDKLPLDTVKTTFTFYGIKGVIDEETLNNIILEHAHLPEILFQFQPGKVEMRLPQSNLVLTGAFIIVDGQKLKFEVEEASFYGLPLEPSAIEELFREGHIVLDLKPLLIKNILYSVKSLEGKLELISRLGLS